MKQKKKKKEGYTTRKKKKKHFGISQLKHGRENHKEVVDLEGTANFSITRKKHHSVYSGLASTVVKSWEQVIPLSALYQKTPSVSP